MFAKKIIQCKEGLYFPSKESRPINKRLKKSLSRRKKLVKCMMHVKNMEITLKGESKWMHLHRMYYVD